LIEVLKLMRHPRMSFVRLVQSIELHKSINNEECIGIIKHWYSISFA
jgi:hypothetical protein